MHVDITQLLPSSPCLAAEVERLRLFYYLPEGIGSLGVIGNVRIAEELSRLLLWRLSIAAVKLGMEVR